MTIFLMGPFTLPFALRSPRLSANGKWAASVLILAYGAYMVWATWRFIQQVMGGGGAGASDLMLLLGR